MSEDLAIPPNTEAPVAELNNYVAEAPDFADMINDTTRVNVFQTRRYSINYPRDEPVDAELTEHQYLNTVNDFLNDAIRESEAIGTEDAEAQKEIAQSMIDSLTYIGEQELETAVTYFADSWKNYLKADPAHHLRVVTGARNVHSASKDGDYVEEPKVKSDAYILDRIIGKFSDEELGEFTGRLKIGVDELTSDPDKTQIVVLDDWSISGNQLAVTIMDIKSQIPPEYLDHLRISLVTATTNQLNDGVYGIPINAYYRAKDVPESDTAEIDNQVHITGSHSQTDYGFSVSMNAMERLSLKQGSGKLRLPPHIPSVYRHLSLEDLSNTQRLLTTAS